MTAVDPRPRRGRSRLRAVRRRSKAAALRRADEAAHHRAAARHDGADDDPRARSGLPSLRLVAVTLVGGFLAAGGANALNMFIDRDIDKLMVRTGPPPARHRRGQPARRARVRPALSPSPRCVWFALARQPADRGADARPRSSCTSSATRCCSSAARRRTSCGAAPQAACRSSSAGPRSPARSSWAPMVLFGVVFFWTPPHYWPLSLRFKDDYAAAGVPMLPVVAPLSLVAREIIGYSWAMVRHVVRCSCPAAGMSAFYAVAAALLGGAFLLGGARPAAPREARRPGREGHAPVPRLDHLPGAALPRGRHRPAAALVDPLRPR